MKKKMIGIVGAPAVVLAGCSGHSRGSTVDFTLANEPHPDTYFEFPVR